MADILKKRILSLFALILLSLTSCYISFGKAEEIAIPYWLQGKWTAQYFPTSLPIEEITEIEITEESIFIRTFDNEYDLINEVLNNAGYDSEYGNVYKLYCNSTMGQNIYTFTLYDEYVLFEINESSQIKLVR